MSYYKTEDNKEMMEDTRDGVRNVTTRVDNAELDKEEISWPDGTHILNKDSPQLDACQAENEMSPQFEAVKVENTDQFDVKGLKLPKEWSSLEDQGFIEPSVGVSTETDVELDTNANSIGVNDLCALEAQAEDNMGQELKNRPTGMELNPDIEEKEEKMSQEETGTKLLQEIVVKDKLSSNEVSGMELPLGNEIKEEELNDRATKMVLPADAESMEEEMDNVVDGSELPLDNEIKEELNNIEPGMEILADNDMREESSKPEIDVGGAVEVKSSNKLFLLEPNSGESDELGTEEEQAAFMKELEKFHKQMCLEFKPPRFYGEPLNCLKLWRAVIRLGGYEQVTSCKLWRQVGESFKPPKTCTTVSWTFRCFYEKALLEYEKYKMRCGELPFADASFTEPASAGNQPGMHQASGLGRARRDAAARAMQGWHSQRLLGNGEVGDPIIKDKNSTSTPKREKQLKSIGLLKRKRLSPVDRAVKAARVKASKPQSDTMVVDIGPPADWVKINVQRTKDCFEVYALVPGLLREEVRVQSDPAGRLVISGQPEQLDNPWGVTPFKKVVSLPSRIDPHQTSAVVTLHGQLFVRVPFGQSDM